MCSNNSFSAVGSSVPHCGRSIDIESAKDVDDSKHADDSHEESPLPFIIKEQIENKCIGNAILEYADKRAPYYPNYPVSSLVQKIYNAWNDFFLNKVILVITLCLYYSFV